MFTKPAAHVTGYFRWRRRTSSKPVRDAATELPVSRDNISHCFLLSSSRWRGETTYDPFLEGFLLASVWQDGLVFDTLLLFD